MNNEAENRENILNIVKGITAGMRACIDAEAGPSDDDIHRSIWRFKGTEQMSLFACHQSSSLFESEQDDSNLFDIGSWIYLTEYWIQFKSKNDSIPDLIIYAYDKHLTSSRITTMEVVSLFPDEKEDDEEHSGIIPQSIGLSADLSLPQTRSEHTDDEAHRDTGSL